ncbi:MAG: hypothetical protein HC836_27780 [Richelia sp. RM2_1_2]|nr:hypothetical protein [Richelia sp. RM2_1_2]
MKEENKTMDMIIDVMDSIIANNENENINAETLRKISFDNKRDFKKIIKDFESEAHFRALMGDNYLRFYLAHNELEYLEDFENYLIEKGFTTKKKEIGYRSSQRTDQRTDYDEVKFIIRW